MDLRRLKKTLIVMCVLHVLGLPLLAISYISVATSDSYAMAGFIPLSVVCLSTALLMGFIIALNTFDYLYKKSKVDMVYSLPLTTRQRFLSDYFAGLFAYTVPYVISVVLALIVDGLAYFGISEWAEQEYGATVYTLKLALCGLFIMVMFYTLTVLVTSCCGSQFEAIAYNLLVNGLIPAAIAVFFVIFFGDLYGINVNDYLLRYISNSSPLGACIGVATIVGSISSTSTLVRWYLLTLAMDVVYFFVAYWLYSKRKAEDVSRPFVFKAFYYVVMSAVTFIIVSIMVELDDSDAIAPMLFLSAIVYFICEVITNRGFKRFGWSVIRYVATVCGVVALCLVLKGTNGFGIEDRVPMASTISSVDVNYHGLYSDSYHSSNDDTTTFKDRDTIQTIVDFHQDAVENHFGSYISSGDYQNYDECSDYYNTVTLTYHTRFGGTISRSYEVSFEQYMLLADLSVDSAYIEKSANDFKDKLLTQYGTPEIYYSNKTPTPDRKSYYINVSSKLRVQSKEYDDISYAKVLELYECYKKDLEARTLDDILTPDDTYCYIDGYTIFSSYTNTIDFLTSNGYVPPSLSVEIQSYNLYQSYSDCVLYSPANITCVGGDYYCTIDAYKAIGGKQLTLDSSLLKLLEVAQPNYITTDKCYMISFQGNLYAIPSEYSSLAKSVYDNSLSYDYL
jgi:hypothetical protein